MPCTNVRVFELLPALVVVQARALRKSETRINAELSDLDKSIILKEALLAQIKDGQASYETMQQVIAMRDVPEDTPL